MWWKNLLFPFFVLLVFLFAFFIFLSLLFKRIFLVINKLRFWKLSATNWANSAEKRQKFQESTRMQLLIKTRFVNLVFLFVLCFKVIDVTWNNENDQKNVNTFGKLFNEKLLEMTRKSVLRKQKCYRHLYKTNNGAKEWEWEWK